MSNKEPTAMEDTNIVPRVQKYLEENIDKTYLDIGLMVTSLRSKYPEYANKPQNRFRRLVEQAYRVVSMSYGLDCQASGNDESDDDDVEVMDETSGGKNMMKNVMNDLYKSKNPKSKDHLRVAGGAEAIDISSDDDDDSSIKDAVAPKKTTEKSNTNSAVSSKTAHDVSQMRVNASKMSSANGDKDTPLSKNAVGYKRRDADQPDTPIPKKFMGLHHHLQQLAQDQYTSAMKNFRNGFNGVGVGVGGIANHQSKQPKKYKKMVNLFQSHTTFQHMGGMEKRLKELCEILIHFKVPDIYYELGVVPPRGILLHGPSGSGKSMLASAIAGQLGIHMMNVPATELIAGVSGESEERIRDIFEQAKAASPCVLFIDEIDAISTNRQQAQKDMERRVVSQLVSSIDSMRQEFNGAEVLIIGATTRPDALDPALRREGRFDYELALTIPTRKERKEILRVICDAMMVDPKLDYDKIAELTPGYVPADLVALVSRAASIAVKKKWSEHIQKIRGERKITIVDLDDDMEDNEEKKKNDKVEDKSVEENKQNAEKPNDTDKTDTAAAGDGAKGETENKQPEVNGIDATADVMEIDEPEKPTSEKLSEEESKESTEPTLTELINWLDSPPDDMGLTNFYISNEDFLDAIKVLQPSAKREGFITVPDVTWDDIGSLRDVREELRLAILAPVKYPERMARLGLEAPSGVLLCGPPGCGKTLIAKAIANEAGINFISVKGPELMNMYVGESERAVRDCFQRARNSAPCVIFFDEFDSLCPKRSNSADNSSGTRIVNQLLTEMDGIQERKGVYIVAATNRPDIIDPAILRPGRLDTILYVGMPKIDDRYEILCATTKNRTTPVLAEDVDLKEIAKRTENFSGADLAGLIRQAAMLALKHALDTNVEANDLCVRMINFEDALDLVRPSISVQDRKIYEGLRQRYAAPR